MFNKLFVITALLVLSPLLKAADLDVDPQESCLLKIDDIPDKANEILKNNKGIFPTLELLQTFSVEFGSGGFNGTVEAFLRPSEDLDVDVSKKAKVQLNLDHNTDVLYVCGHYEAQEPTKSHISVYFLRGNGLSGESASFSDKVASAIWGNEIKFARASIGFDGILGLPSVVARILEKVPAVNIVYGLIKGVLSAPVNVLGSTALQVTRLDVQGIVYTPQGLEVISDAKDGTPSAIQSKTKSLKKQKEKDQQDQNQVQVPN